MPHDNFNDISFTATMVAVASALWGTIINFSKRDVSSKTALRKILIFVSDFMISSGFTMLTYLGLCGYGVNDLLAVSLAGFVGHLGIRSSHLVELVIAEKVGAKDTFNYIKEEGYD